MELYERAMTAETQADADVIFERCVQRCMTANRTRAEAEAIERNNIGYYTGYFSRETAKRVFRLFKCEHPIFGKTQPTPEEAFATGVRMGEEAARKARAKE